MVILTGTAGVGLQELEVAQLDRVLPADPPDHAGDRVGVAAAVERGPRVVDVDALERGGEAVRVALAPHLAVGDDVEAGPLLIADGEDGGVVLRLLEPLRADPPELVGPHPRREARRQLLSIDEPVGLRVGAHEGGREELGHGTSLSGSRPPHKAAGTRTVSWGYAVAS